MEQRKDRPKVVVSERFAFEWGTHCWHLHETREGRNRKTGEVTTSTRTTYHPNLTQIAETIIDRSAGNGNSIRTIIESIENARDAVIEAIEGMLTASPAPEHIGDDNKMVAALRQYRHNDDSGFVFAYDKEQTDRIVAGLVEALEQIAGRSSYAVYTVSEAIKKAWPQLSEHDKELIKREIRDAIISGCCGMECDRGAWEAILCLE